VNAAGRARAKSVDWAEMEMKEPEPAEAPRDRQLPDRVQCPNCCRMAPITSRSMGLWFFECELCLTTGAVPDPGDRGGA
jgi:hypothetical protein